MNGRLQLVILGGFLLAAFAGCTSPKYQSAPKKTPPPVLLNLPSTESPIEALLHTVIVYRGPGSWKRDAYWDEYVVTVANRGPTQVTVESAAVIDFRSEIITAGGNPWEVEEASSVFMEQDSAKAVAVQTGTNLGVLALSSGAGAALIGDVMVGSTTGAAAGAAAGGFLALPILIGGTIYSNISNRNLIEREFNRRRFTLPATLSPGQFVQGSFFFRISPGPKRLVLRCSIDGESREVAIELTPLASLHLQRVPVAAKPAGPPQR